MKIPYITTVIKCLINYIYIYVSSKWLHIVHNLHACVFFSFFLIICYLKKNFDVVVDVDDALYSRIYVSKYLYLYTFRKKKNVHFYSRSHFQYSLKQIHNMHSCSVSLSLQPILCPLLPFISLSSIENTILQRSTYIGSYSLQKLLGLFMELLISYSYW